MLWYVLLIPAVSTLKKKKNRFRRARYPSTLRYCYQLSPLVASRKGNDGALLWTGIYQLWIIIKGWNRIIFSVVFLPLT